MSPYEVKGDSAETSYYRTFGTVEADGKFQESTITCDEGTVAGLTDLRIRRFLSSEV
jgi:hypothetical protein